MIYSTAIELNNFRCFRHRFDPMIKNNSTNFIASTGHFMKKVISLSSLILVMFFMVARCAPGGDRGIHFYDKSWQEVVNKAKTEHKLIFLDIYASWCGPCKMLRSETFADKDVAAFFNANFVNTSFDGEVGDGIMLAKKYKINGYPALFVIDEDGNVIKFSLGYVTPEQLLGFGKRALKK